MARDYGFRVFAADLWSNPTDNKRFFDEMGLTSDQIIPLKADADALPFLKRGGYLYIAMPGMKRDLHHELPPELLLFWTPEDLDAIHDAAWWEQLIRKTPGIEALSVRQMESNEEVWNDWLLCDNEYARGDRGIFEAGGRYLNFVSIILKRT